MEYTLHSHPHNCAPSQDDLQHTETLPLQPASTNCNKPSLSCCHSVLVVHLHMSLKAGAPLLPRPMVHMDSTLALPRWLALTLACAFTPCVAAVAAVAASALCVAAAVSAAMTTPTATATALSASTTTHTPPHTIALRGAGAYRGTASRQAVPGPADMVLSAERQPPGVPLAAGVGSPRRPSSMVAPWTTTALAAVAAAAVAFFAGLRRLLQRSAEPAPLDASRWDEAVPEEVVAMAATFGATRGLFGLRKRERRRSATFSDPTVYQKLPSKYLPSMSIRTRFRSDYAKAYPKFMEALEEHFPGAMPEVEFLAKTTALLNAAGLNRDNAIPMIALCRDEFTRDLAENVDELWGQSFSMGSIAGMVNIGTTGMGAGMAHAPVCPDGVERYVFISAPHIAIGDRGEVGKCYRPGRAGTNAACGALLAMLAELQSGKMTATLDTADLEISKMKQQLLGYFTYGEVPTLVQLTKASRRLIEDQLEAILAAKDLSNTEFAFVSGVQVHGPDGFNFFWPAVFYIRKRGSARVDIDVQDLVAVDATELLQGLYASDLAKVMFVVAQGDLRAVAQWVEDGSDVNAQDTDGVTVLNAAAANGHKDIVFYLLTHGADPSILDHRGRGPLQEAVAGGFQRIAELLAAKGAELPLNVAELFLWRAAREGDLPLAQAAVQFGPAGLVTSNDGEGDRPLWAAVRSNHVQVARYLVSVGATKAGTDTDGHTLSEMAKRRGYWDLVDDNDEDKAAFFAGTHSSRSGLG